LGKSKNKKEVKNDLLSNMAPLPAAGLSTFGMAGPITPLD